MKISKVFHIFLLLLFFTSRHCVSNDRSYGMYTIRTYSMLQNKINYAVQLETGAITFKCNSNKTENRIQNT